ncbi:MAG: DUF3566 domain-containing protein, partial [Acidimicrobiia bacterium]|nr:DUF3566 domain-containing protein [Acidimicrobiia bacterium]
MTDAQNPVRRHVRRIDVWAVTKVSLLFFVVVGIIWLVTALVLWRVLHAFDLVDKIEDLAGRLVGGDFRLRGTDLLKAFVMLDVVWVLGAATFTIILAVVYNLIADVVGGITFVVEDKVPKRDRTLVSALRSRLRGEKGKDVRAEPRARPTPKPGRPARPAARPAPKPGETPAATRRPVRPAALAGTKQGRQTATSAPAASTAAAASAAASTATGAAAVAAGKTRASGGNSGKASPGASVSGKAASGAGAGKAASAASGKAQVRGAQKSPASSQAKTPTESPTETKGA